MQPTRSIAAPSVRGDRNTEGGNLSAQMASKLIFLLTPVPTFRFDRAFSVFKVDPLR